MVHEGHSISHSLLSTSQKRSKKWSDPPKEGGEVACGALVHGTALRHCGDSKMPSVQGAAAENPTVVGGWFVVFLWFSLLTPPKRLRVKTNGTTLR